MKTKFEIMKLLEKRTDSEFVILRHKDPNEYVPLRFREYLKSAGVVLEIYDDVGNCIGTFRGFVPIKGGTILYHVEKALD